MQKKVLSVVLLLLIGFLVYISHEKEIKPGIDENNDINKLVKVGWSNLGSWIYLYDPTIDIYVESTISEISFYRENEDMCQSGDNAYLVEQFIDKVNKKFYQSIKLIRCKNNGQSITLEYQDGSWITWEYSSKKAHSALLYISILGD